MTLEKSVSESWPERLKREATRNVVRMDREFESPFTPEAQDLDLVTLLFRVEPAPPCEARAARAFASRAPLAVVV